MIDYKKKFENKNKIAFIIGGSGLIGSECVAILKMSGAKIVVLDKNSNFSSIKNKKNSDIFYDYFDCSNLNTIDINLNKIIKKYGCPDILVNCSYPKTNKWKTNSFNKIKLKELKNNLEIHLTSFAWIARYIANQMAKNKKKGSIIQFASIYGLVGQDLNIYKNTNFSENMSYSVINGGIISLTKQMASYYGKYNIRINNICPGGILDKKNQPKKLIKNYSTRVPMKRMCEKEEVAPAVLFLASDASSYITGTNLIIDGGWTSI